MFIERLKSKYSFNEPIFTNEILELFQDYSRPYVFRLINMSENTGELINFDIGVYYMPMESPIGTSTITAEDVINKKYIEYKGEVYGIYSGLNLQNYFSITEQIPNTIEIVTNNESMRCRKITIDDREFILRKSRCKIDSNNVQAYTILQLFTEMNFETDMNDKINETIKEFMINNDVNVADLISLSKFFPAQTTKNLINSGVLNDFTQR